MMTDTDAEIEGLRDQLMHARFALLDITKHSLERYAIEVADSAVAWLDSRPKLPVIIDAKLVDFERTILMSVVLAMNGLAKIDKMTNSEVLAITDKTLARIDQRRAARVTDEALKVGGAVDAIG